MLGLPLSGGEGPGLPLSSQTGTVILTVKTSSAFCVQPWGEHRGAPALVTPPPAPGSRRGPWPRPDQTTHSSSSSRGGGRQPSSPLREQSPPPRTVSFPLPQEAPQTSSHPGCPTFSAAPGGGVPVTVKGVPGQVVGTTCWGATGPDSRSPPLNTASGSLLSCRLRPLTPPRMATKQ